MTQVINNIQSFGPVFLVLWAITLVSVWLRPQRYANSFLLMLSLLVSMLFAAGFFGDSAGYILLTCFLLVTLALLLVPLLLVINGIQMIRRESLCLAHLLSLGLGLMVGVGEVATVVYVLGLSEFISFAWANKWVMLLSMTVFYFSSLVLSFVVYSLFVQVIPHRSSFDYLIIHGCGLVDGKRPTKLLANRIDKAITLYQRSHNKPIIIPSGGKGADEEVSEAQAMKTYLMEHSIPEDHIILEDRSATTRENLANSKALIDAREGRKRTALISSNYHVYRCLRLAKEVGLRCTGVGADVALYYWPSALIREFIAIFVTKGFLIWSLIGYVLFVGPVLLFYAQ